MTTITKQYSYGLRMHTHTHTLTNTQPHHINTDEEDAQGECSIPSNQLGKLATLLCCFTGGPDFTASLRHYCVSTDELSLTVGEGGGGAGEQWREGKSESERESERERRNGVLPPQRHTHASRSNSSRLRTEHPPYFSLGNPVCFLIIEALQRLLYY